MKSSMERYPQAFARLLCAADLYVGPIQELAIVGEHDSDSTRSLLSVSRERYFPNLLAMCANPEDNTAGLPLLERKTQLNGQPTAYVCQNYACTHPVTTVSDLARILDEPDHLM